MATSLLIGKPFAASYASGLPEEIRRSAIFKKITFGISAAWTVAQAALLIGSIITALRPSTETWSTWVVTVAALVLALRFQHWYPGYVRSSAGLSETG